MHDCDFSIPVQQNIICFQAHSRPEKAVLWQCWACLLFTGILSHATQHISSSVWSALSNRRLVLVHTLTSEVLRPHQAPVHTGLLPRASSMSSWVKWRHWHFQPFLFKYNKMLNEQIHIRKYETATERRSRAETTDESQEDLRRINYLRNQGGE